MNQKLCIAALLVLVGGAAWLLHYFSDQQVIRRKLFALAVSLTKEGEENPLTIALKMTPVKEFIAPACEVVVPERSYHQIFEPGLLTHYLISYRSRRADLQVAFTEISIEIPSKGRGEVSALVRVTANHHQADFADETHRVMLSLRKEENNWLLRKAVLPDALARR